MELLQKLTPIRCLSNPRVKSWALALQSHWLKMAPTSLLEPPRLQFTGATLTQLLQSWETLAIVNALMTLLSQEDIPNSLPPPQSMTSACGMPRPDKSSSESKYQASNATLSNSCQMASPFSPVGTMVRSDPSYLNLENFSMPLTMHTTMESPLSWQQMIARESCPVVWKVRSGSGRSVIRLRSWKHP